jgi:hypothetical protein
MKAKAPLRDQPFMWAYIWIAVVCAALVLGFMPEKYAKKFEKTILFKIMGVTVAIVFGGLMILSAGLYLNALIEMADAILAFLRSIF